MRILFMGTPDIAAESLAALLEAGHEVCAVFTRRADFNGPAGQTAGDGARHSSVSAPHSAGWFVRRCH